jgi:HD-GYP domain-containing protein (c-di-GMP phosphodiesterase class II)
MGSFAARPPIPVQMSFTPDFAQQERLADTLRRPETQMMPVEQLADWLVGLGFLAAAVAVWAHAPPHGFASVPAVICLLLMVVATLVRFDTPFGFTVATQLAFVPLLFALPLALVAPAVVLALALARLPDVWRGKVRPTRLVQVVGNSWFAIGPVAVFVIAHTEPRDAGAGLLVLALAAQFVIDFAVSTVRLWIAHNAPLSSQLNDLWVYGIDAALSGIALVVAEEVGRAPAAPLALFPLLGLLAIFARDRRDRLESLIELNNAYRGTALVLGDVVEADDGYTGAHSRGVVALSLELGLRLGLDARQRRNLEFGALLHDVGKIAISKEIINKPGTLDDEEWTIIKTHTVEGQRLLDTVGGFMRDVGLIVRSHHERWDGRGYPDELAGEDIPLEARIVACCDTWNAMRTDRAYRRTLPFDVAIAEIESVAGSQLDPGIVRVLVEVLRSGEQEPLAPRGLRS